MSPFDGIFILLSCNFLWEMYPKDSTQKSEDFLFTSLKMAVSRNPTFNDMEKHACSDVSREWLHNCGNDFTSDFD